VWAPRDRQALRCRSARGEVLRPEEASRLQTEAGRRAARKLLEADLGERPAATLPHRREYLGRVAGVSVSDSTLSRALKRLGWSRKKDRWERQNATSS
jgi:transposase